MTRIDLIPPEIVEKHKSRRVIAIEILIFVVFLAMLLVVYFVTLGQAMMASDRVDIIKNENNKVQDYTKKLKAYDDRKKSLDERTKIIETITTDQVQWSSILNDISMVVPNDIWLKDVKINIKPILDAKEASASQQKTEPPPPVVIVGYAFDHAAVARWLVHLNEINQFRGVWLNYATEQTISTGSATSGPTTQAQNIRVIEFQTTVYLTKFKDEESKK